MVIFRCQFPWDEGGPDRWLSMLSECAYDSVSGVRRMALPEAGDTIQSTRGPQKTQKTKPKPNQTKMKVRNDEFPLSA